MLSENYLYNILTKGMAFREYGGGIGAKNNTFSFKNEKTDEEFKLLDKLNKQFNDVRVKKNKATRTMKIKNPKDLLEELRRLENELRVHILKQKRRYYLQYFDNLESRQHKVELLSDECINNTMIFTDHTFDDIKSKDNLYKVVPIKEMLDKNPSKKKCFQSIKEFEESHGKLNA